MKAMTSGIIFLLCCLTTTGSLWAQGDTVQHRQLKSWLPDSTQVQYEIGQVTLSNAYGKKYIRFVDSSSLTPDVFLRSVAFIKQTADDTIEFTRFANFDNKNYYKFPSATVQDSMSDTKFDSMMRSAHAYYDTLQVRPQPFAFDTSSMIRYIVEMRLASNDSVLRRLDTLWCYLDPLGELRYQVSWKRLSFVHLLMRSAIPLDTLVYLAVRQESALPLGSYLTYSGRGAYTQRPTRTAFKFKYQDVPWLGSLKQAYPRSLFKQ